MSGVIWPFSRGRACVAPWFLRLSRKWRSGTGWFLNARTYVFLKCPQPTVQPQASLARIGARIEAEAHWPLRETSGTPGWNRANERALTVALDVLGPSHGATHRTLAGVRRGGTTDMEREQPGQCRDSRHGTHGKSRPDYPGDKDRGLRSTHDPYLGLLTERLGGANGGWRAWCDARSQRSRRFFFM